MNKKIIILSVVLILVVVAIIAIVVNLVVESNVSLKLNKKVSKLEESLENDKEINYNRDNFCIFLSVSDGINKSYVISKKNTSLKGAIQDAKKEMIKVLKEKNIDPEWVRIDVLDKESKKEIKTVEKELEMKSVNGYRYGLSFDEEHDIAFLEAEVNANEIINYSSNKINLGKINSYLESDNKITNKDQLKELPDKIYTFSCIGYVYDSKDVYKINSDTENMDDIGRRENNGLDELELLEIMEKGASYLKDAVEDDGSYVYRYNAINGKRPDTYNILRHEGTTWSMIQVYKLTKNSELKEAIKKAVKYVVDNCVRYKDDNTAFVIESKNNEIKLGANGIAAVMFTEYMETFETDEYKELLEKIGNGILDMQNDNGSYYHVYEYPDFNKKEKFRTVYYDGEATFALSKIYGYTKDEKWLKRAEKSIDYFIKNNYKQYKDQWIEYSVNEVTKHNPKEKYFRFGIENGLDNLERIVNDPYEYPVDLELLTTCVEIYDRAIKNNIDVSKYNIKDLISGVHYRADMQLNGFFYPEVSMYFEKPDIITGAFFVRSNSFRIRIDDVQHNISGYYNIYRLYKEIERYSK